MFSLSVSPISPSATNLNIIIISGNPTEEYYNDDYNAEYDYDEDLTVNDVSDDKVLSHIPKIVSNPVKLDVDNGMTIRLPCTVDKLPGRPGLLLLSRADNDVVTLYRRDSDHLEQDGRQRNTDCYRAHRDRSRVQGPRHRVCG